MIVVLDGALVQKLKTIQWDYLYISIENRLLVAAYETLRQMTACMHVFLYSLASYCLFILLRVILLNKLSISLRVFLLTMLWQIDL